MSATVSPPFDEAADPRNYGAIADGVSRLLSGGYTTLAAAQAVYPHATALTDQLDWAAAQKAANSGAKAVRYLGHYITNRMITVSNGQSHFGRGPQDIIENIRPRNTPSENQLHATAFEVGNMHPAILGGLASSYEWAVHALSPISAGDKTVVVATPASVSVAAGDIVVIRSNNTPEAVGSGQVYAFTMWNKVVSWDPATGQLVLELPVPVSIVATGGVTTLFGPKLCVNAGFDSFRGTGWWMAQDVTIRDLKVAGMVPINTRCGAWRCLLENLQLDCQHILVTNAFALSKARNLKGYFTSRFLEVKMWSQDSLYEDFHGVYKNDPTITPKTPISIAEQSYDCDFREIGLHVGRNWTQDLRMLEISSPRIKFQGRISYFGTGGSLDVWAIKSNKHQARPPADVELDLVVRSAGGLARYGTVGSDPDLDGIANEGDPTRFRWTLNQRTVEGAVPSSGVRVDRGSKGMVVSDVSDYRRVAVNSPAEVPERASYLLTTVAGPVTYLANTDTLVGSFTLTGCLTGDDVRCALQQAGSITSGVFGSLLVTASVAAANSVTVYVRNRSATDVTITGASAFFVYAQFIRNRVV